MHKHVPNKSYCKYVYVYKFTCVTNFIMPLFNLSSGNRKPDVSELHKHIVPKYATRWRDLGVQLKLPISHLDEIAEDNANRPSCSRKCCKAMLQKWMKITPNATWDMLHSAIDCLSDLSHDGNSESME